MIPVLDPDELTGFRDGYFTVYSGDGRVYLITSDGAIPVNGVRTITEIDDDLLTRIGSDWFNYNLAGKNVVILTPPSPITVGDTVFEGSIPGIHYGETDTMSIPLGVTFVPAISPNQAIIYLSNNIVSEDAIIGTSIGALSVTNGSGSYTYSILAQTPAGKLSIDGDELKVADALDYETDPSLSVTIQADNGVGAPIGRIFTINVTNVLDGPTLNALTLSTSEIIVDEPASINIVGAQTGSTITSSALPDGLTLDSGARTISGTPTEIAETPITLTETLADSPNSPRVSNVSIAVANAPAEQVAQFGANTPAGTGGFRPLSSDGTNELEVISVVDQADASRTWSVSDGRLVANGTPDADDGKTITVDTAEGKIACTIGTVADAQSVANLTELMAVPWIASAYSGDGGTAMLRYGEYDTRSQNWTNRLNGLTSPAKITSHRHNLRAKLNGWHQSAVADTTLEWLWLHLPWADAITEQGGWSGFRSIFGSSGSDITISHCAFTSDMPRAREYPDEWLTEERLQATLGRPFIFGCEMDGDNITIEHCEFERLTHGIYYEGSGCIASDNFQHECWGDMFEQYGRGVGTTTGNNAYLNNILIDPISEQHNVHVDFLQVGTPAGTHSDIVVRGNIVAPGWEGRRNSAIVPLSFAQANGFLVDEDTTLDGTIATNQLVWVNAYDGPITITLPLASAGKNVIVHKVDSSANAVTVQAQGGDTFWSTDYPSINGEYTYTSNRRFGAMWFMNSASGANDYRYREGADSLQAIILQGSGDFIDWLVEGNIICLAGWTGITFEVSRIGAGSARNAVRYNTLFGPYPDDITGDGLITVADGLGPNAGPYIELPSGASNSGHRNIFGSVRNSAGSTFVDNIMHGGANLTAYSDIFENVGTTFMVEPPKENYNDIASDGGPNIETLDSRMSYLREYTADVLLAKSGVTQGAVGTSRTNGFIDWDTMAVNSPDPVILTGPDLGEAQNFTQTDFAIVTDKPTTLSITGGADAAQFSIPSPGVLRLSEQMTARAYEVEITATDDDNNTDVEAFTVTVQEGEALVYGPWDGPIVEFDSATPDLFRTASVGLASADNSKITVAVLGFKCEAPDATNFQYIFTRNTGVGQVELVIVPGSGAMRIHIRNAAGSAILARYSTSIGVCDGNSHDIIFALDIDDTSGATGADVYVDNVSRKTVTQAPAAPSVIPFTTAQLYQVGPREAWIPDFELGGLYIKAGTRVDLSSEINRLKFLHSQMEDDGVKPTGSAPEVWITGTASEYNDVGGINKGSGPKFVKVGSTAVVDV